MAIDIAYGVFTSERGYPPEGRRAAAERVCLPLLRVCGDAALREFYLDHITEIMSTVESNLSKVSAVDGHNTPAAVIEPRGYKQGRLCEYTCSCVVVLEREGIYSKRQFASKGCWLLTKF